jgi:hypothetical protein
MRTVPRLYGKCFPGFESLEVHDLEDDEGEPMDMNKRGEWGEACRISKKFCQDLFKSSWRLETVAVLLSFSSGFLRRSVLFP